MRTTVAKLLNSEVLSSTELAALCAALFDGLLSEGQTAAVLTAWRLRGETKAELAAGAIALRARAARVNLPAAARPLVDNCGTGGDGMCSFNVSTAAAIVAAAAGVRVAKHGNRSASGQCGSADLLFAAGFPASLSPAAASELLMSTGFSFFFAPGYHPSLAKLATLRRELGVRTLLNLLGPLANPIAPDYQLLGVGALAYLKPMAEALSELGVKRALVVHGRDGLDEISPVAPTDAFWVEAGQLRSFVIEPASLGIAAVPADLLGGNAEHNLAMLKSLLAGEASPGLTAAVALNAGGVLWVSGHAASLAAGLALARELISTKVAQSFFHRWLETANAFAHKG